MGKAGATSSEATAKWEYGQERKLHKQISGFFTIRNIVFIHSRTDKRTTTATGVPDYIIFLPNLPEICIEVKIGKGELRDGQEKWHAKYKAATGRAVFVVRSLDEVKSLLP